MKSGLVVFALVVLLTTACTSTATPTATPAPVYSVVTEASLKAGAAIPAPEDEVILTVTGKIGAANVDNSIQMDLKTIEAAGLVDYTVEDPFENKEVVYRGPLMSDLLALWKVPDDATTLQMVALNDYAIDVPLSDLRKYPVIFALQADGEYLPISTRGPAMLVYPYNDFEFEQSVYNDYWIWQIKSIEVQ